MRRVPSAGLFIAGIGSLLLAILAGVLANIVTDGGQAMLIGLVILTILFGLLGLAYQSGRRTTARFGSPIVIRDLVGVYTEGRRGLIGVVSLYKPNANSPAANLTRAERLEAAQKLDYDALCLEQSNLLPLITAVNAHAPSLTQCWLIATQADDAATSSLTYAPVVAHYLRQVKGLKCQFHSGEQYVLVIEKDDALIADNAHRLVNRIFEQAAQLPLPISEHEMVADITSGMRTVTLGMIMACLDRRRMVQFVGTRYDEFSQPTGDLLPILFTYEAEIANR